MGVKAERAAVWEGAKEVKTAVRVGVGEDWGTKDETRTISRVGEAVGESCGGCQCGEDREDGKRGYLDQPLQHLFKLGDIKEIKRLPHREQRQSFHIKPRHDSRKRWPRTPSSVKQVFVFGLVYVQDFEPGRHDINSHHIFTRPTPVLSFESAKTTFEQAGHRDKPCNSTPSPPAAKNPPTQHQDNDPRETSCPPPPKTHSTPPTSQPDHSSPPLHPSRVPI